MALIYTLICLSCLLVLYCMIVIGYEIMTDYYIQRDYPKSTQEIPEGQMDDGFFMSAMYLDMGNDL